METLDRKQVVEMLRREQGERSLRQFGIAVAMSAAYLSDVIRGNREPGPRILKLLKLRRIKAVSIRYARMRGSR
jgi:hypothetical protein